MQLIAISIHFVHFSSLLVEARNLKTHVLNVFVKINHKCFGRKRKEMRNREKESAIQELNKEIKKES
jgi:hypothetical protein